MTEPFKMNTTPRQNVRSLQVVFAALTGGVVLLSLTGTLVLAINGPLWQVDDWGHANLLLAAAGIISVVGVWGARSYYARTMEMGAQTFYLLSDKLNQYRAAMIIYMALCEGPALFSVVIFLLTGNFIALVFIAISVTGMCLKMPTRKRIIKELSLDWRDQQEI